MNDSRHRATRSDRHAARRNYLIMFVVATLSMTALVGAAFAFLD